MGSCNSCVVGCDSRDDHPSPFVQLGGTEDYIVALAGNPNTGKSTVFNHLTGLRQHTGNWPGKTVARAEGTFSHAGKRFRLVDLPGTYSLLADSVDEQVARDFVLYGRPHCTIVVCDATVLERNLHLVLQIVEITDRVVVCVNLMDEAERKRIAIDLPALERELGVPVVSTSARQGRGIDTLIQRAHEVASGQIVSAPRRGTYEPPVETALERLSGSLTAAYPGIACARWIAMRLLDGDPRIEEAMASGVFAADANSPGLSASDLQDLVQETAELRRQIGGDLHDRMTGALYARAGEVAEKAVRVVGKPGADWDLFADRILTSRWLGIPIMLLGLIGILWLTITGANHPGALIATVLFWIQDRWAEGMEHIGAPWWLTGFLVSGVFRGLAWVISVMLPPMAIFFPIFTLLEDVGYLPRVAFNLDRVFRWSGAHGKQSLTMGMGYGCNAAGVVACRIIDSPRERLIAILTNNFMLCNGRWPTIIMLATVFVAAAFPPAWSSLIATGSVVTVTLLGVLVTFLVSRLLSQTVLKGEASHFYLELPPYRRPNILRVLHRSFIDRTIFVLGRACVTAAPAGGLIWLLGNVHVGDGSVMSHLIDWLNPVGWLLGLDGAILLAYIIALPANEIVVPTLIMAYMSGTQMTDLQDMSRLSQLFQQNNWTLTTAACMMLFSLLHYPCATTTWTIYRETGSVRWTLWSNLMPLAIAVLVCAAVAYASRLLAG